MALSEFDRTIIVSNLPSAKTPSCVRLTRTADRRRGIGEPAKLELWSRGGPSLRRPAPNRISNRATARSACWHRVGQEAVLIGIVSQLRLALPVREGCSFD